MGELSEGRCFDEWRVPSRAIPRDSGHSGVAILNAKVQIVLDLFATATSLGSIVFMALVFYAEIFGGFGTILYNGAWTNSSPTFIEPNLFIKSVEFVTIIAGFVSTLYLFVRRLRY